MSLTTPPGMRYTPSGALVWRKTGRTKRSTPIPNKTLEALFGCRVVDLSYWGDAPPPSMVWAVDDDRQAHLVHLDRRATVAHHTAKCRLGCSLPDRKANWR